MKSTLRTVVVEYSTLTQSSQLKEVKFDLSKTGDPTSSHTKWGVRGPRIDKRVPGPSAIMRTVSLSVSRSSTRPLRL
jgi:hypothetical protein